MNLSDKERDLIFEIVNVYQRGDMPNMEGDIHEDESAVEEKTSEAESNGGVSKKEEYDGEECVDGVYYDEESDGSGCEFCGGDCPQRGCDLCGGDCVESEFMKGMFMCSSCGRGFIVSPGKQTRGLKIKMVRRYAGVGEVPHCNKDLTRGIDLEFDKDEGNKDEGDMDEGNECEFCGGDCAQRGCDLCGGDCVEVDIMEGMFKCSSCGSEFVVGPGEKTSIIRWYAGVGEVPYCTKDLASGDGDDERDVHADGMEADE
ncbi:hypothetical protein MMC12_006801 [Toensbergia leucococca]|nr:hypothetical protein [Toensbergia leucococca]